MNVISKQTCLRLDEYEKAVYNVIFPKSIVSTAVCISRVALIMINKSRDEFSIIFLYDLDWMQSLNKLGVSSVKLKSLMVVKE